MILSLLSPDSLLSEVCSLVKLTFYFSITVTIVVSSCKSLPPSSSVLASALASLSVFESGVVSGVVSGSGSGSVIGSSVGSTSSSGTST